MTLRTIVPLLFMAVTSGCAEDPDADPRDLHTEQIRTDAALLGDGGLAFDAALGADAAPSVDAAGLAAAGADARVAAVVFDARVSDAADGASVPTEASTDRSRTIPEDASPDSATPSAPNDAGVALAPGLAGRVTWLGRVDLRDLHTPAFAWSGSGFEAHLSGGTLSVTLDNDEPFVFKPVIDGVPEPTFTAQRGLHAYVLANGLPPGDHHVALYRQTEGIMGATRVRAVDVQGGELLPPTPTPARLIEVVGDSISAGYGNLTSTPACTYSFETQSHWDSYGAVAARALSAALSTVAASGHGVSRDRERGGNVVPPLYELTRPGGTAFPFASSPEPQAVILNLGTNDFAAGDPGSQFSSALLGFLARVRSVRPSALIVCSLGPMVEATALASLRDYLQGAVKARNEVGDAKVVFLEFATQTRQERGCDQHPNVAKHKQMGEQLETFLRGRLRW